MLDDDHDKDMMRRQMRAMLLIGAVVMGWMYFMAPKPPVVEPGQESVAETEQARADSSPSSALPDSSANAANPDAPVQWPNLPEVPSIKDAFEDEVVIEDDELRLVFTKIGARLKQANIKLSNGVEETFQMIPVEEEFKPDTDMVYPFGLRFTHSDIRDALDIRRFEVQETTLDSITFRLTLPDSLEVTKTFSFSEKSHVLNVDISYRNLETRSRLLGLDLEPAYTLNWGPGVNAPSSGRLFKPSVLWNPEGEPEPEKQYLNDLPKAGNMAESRRMSDVDWIGHRTKYFLAAFRNGGDEGTVDGWVSGTQEDVRFGVTVPRFEVAANETHSTSFQVYLGPMHLSELTKAWPTLPNALTFFDYPNFLDWFAKLLLTNLNWWYGFFGNYGVSIILLTLVVRLVMLPLTLKSMRSMKAMQALQPELKELKEKYGDSQEDKQAFAQAQMEMFRERGVNPLGGCLPMFLQMPIFIALYRMIMNAFEMRGATFLWIDDLSFPDRLIHLPFLSGVPFVGQYIEYLNILPLLMVVAMVFSMRMNSSSAMQNPQQQMMMRIMPIFFGVVSYPFSAGINLYVLTSTVLGIVQQQVINRSKDPESDSAPAKVKKKKKKTVEDVRKKRKQHFYTRAQERKREQAKEERRNKKKKKK
ncbi:MAG: membrane protein insertase YidC [Candidatus Hydrogenedentota bacterium]